MARPTRRPPPGVHVVTQEEMEKVRGLIRTGPREPLRKTGTVEKCPECKGRLVTTNDLVRTMVVPGGILRITRLPGARCSDCGVEFYDAAAVTLVEDARQNEIIADYETKVTRAAGKMLGTYFRADLVRVLGLKGKEILKWKVVGRNRAVVDVER